MQPKINWIDNLRGIACLMVVMIHTTTWYITNAHSVSPLNWDIANVLNSASRVSVPLFFMISGYLFFWRALRATAAFFTYRPVPYLLQRCRPGLHFTFYFDQRRAFAKKCAAKTRVLPPVVFLCDCGDLPGIAINPGKKRERQNAPDADGGHWYYC